MTHIAEHPTPRSDDAAPVLSTSTHARAGVAVHVTGVRGASRSSACGHGCGRSPARSTTCASRVTTSSTPSGRYSVIVVRGDDGELRAFQNVCRHRGNTFCQGAGKGLVELRCPWHGWTWGLDGRLREVPVAALVRRAAQRRLPAVPRAGRHVGPARVREPRRRRAAARRVPRGRARRLPRGPTSTSSAAWPPPPPMCRATGRSSPTASARPTTCRACTARCSGSIDDLDTPQRLWGHHGVSYQRYGARQPPPRRSSTTRRCGTRSWRRRAAAWARPTRRRARRRRCPTAAPCAT